MKSTTDTVIPKLSIKLIRASIEAEDGEYVIEENNRMTQTNGLRLAKGLLTVTDKKTHIWIKNPYPRPLKIMKDQTLAYGSLPAEVNFIENIEKQNENDEIQFQINKNLSFKEQERLKQILAKYTDLFSSMLDRTNLAKHQIHTEDSKPIKHKPYRVSAKERTIIKDQIDEMLEEGIIRPSSSPWSFPVILVKKRDGNYRFCVDYRKLNEYFSAIDLKSGYWQVEIEERDKEKTAFTTAHGLYEFNVMPFGLCNAPATFERNMDNVLGNLRWQICLCYLDDVIIYSSDFPTHIKILEAVLRCFSESNLKLNANKCRFAFEEHEILGHITNQEGIKPAEYNIKAVRDFPQPKKAKEVQSFLGMCSYYRKFIKDFSLIADPLTSLIRKKCHFDPNAATCIHTDAYNIGLGATLIQNFGGEEKNLKDPTGRLARWALKIQEYNFEIIHKSGKKHLDADGLSRGPLPDNEWDEDYERLFLNQIIDEKDDFIENIKENLSGNKRSITQNFKEENGCLYKENPNPEGREWLLVVPKKRRKDIMTNYPFERVGIDFVGPLPSTKRRRKWIIVLTDYYTKYTETKAVPEATVKEVSKFLIAHIFLRHGAPRFLISDRGSQFTSNLMKEDEILPFITHAYNTTIQETIGYSPFFLLFGREPMSLLDDENIPTESNMDDYDEYTENYLDKIARTRQVVINNTEKTQKRMKRNYDKKHNERIYEPGHLVEVWTPVRKIGKCEKLLRKYFGPYRILKKLSNVNYLIEPKDNPGQDPLIVHVSRLKPYFERIDEIGSEKEQSWRNKPTIPTKRPRNLSPNKRDIYGGNAAPRDFRRPANTDRQRREQADRANDSPEIPASHGNRGTE
ncbi:K02A2.6-like [Cordylochernes scorpioides]|uniref:K02A2.6-like n=1 Tax=Cordylochernes scorpioides TaxID=51811 RepID=A0ABY6KT77_9ARAC|nr:K02A2.6-like [Cordylochernes scorpioides]